MPFTSLDTTAISRSLYQIAEREGDLADAFFERSERLELPDVGDPPGVRVCREQGFAVRLVREGRSWLATRDEIEPVAFGDALRQVARVMPSAPYSPPALPFAEWPPPAPPQELYRLPGEVTRAIRRRLAGFPLQLSVRRHRRWIRVVGTRLAPEQQTEEFYSYRARMPWGRDGGLLTSLDEGAVERIADSLTSMFRARESVTVDPGRRPAVLAPLACAVLLHEVVAHALETDTLALGGRIEAALGVRVGNELLNVLDDPAGAPVGVRRATDDEGMLVMRRWLLRAGVVEQPLADLLAAHRSPTLMPGAGRRSDRHSPPVPRSSHLELVPGESAHDDLTSDISDGLFLPAVSEGSLDPLSGRYQLHVPWGREIRRGSLGRLVGPFTVAGRVSELLDAVSGVGSEAMIAGAGWCAKGGVRLPVWATAPALRVEALEVTG